MNENINLCEILKGYEGKTFYSPIYGVVILSKVTQTYIDVLLVDDSLQHIKFLPDGKISDVGECMLFPYSDQRDWNKWAKDHKPIIPKTWDDIQDNIADDFYKVNEYYTSPIKKSARAFLKIHQLIEVGYGGNVKEIGYHTAGIDSELNIIIEEEFDEDFNILRPLIFKNTQVAKEFLSYSENVQLIKDYYNGF